MRRHRGLYWIGVLVSAFAVVAGLVVAYTGWLSASGPDRVVRDYFAAIARGDAAGALGWGEAPSGAPGLLSDQALAVQRSIATIHNLDVVAIDRDVGGHATVTFVYLLRFASGDVPVTDRLELERRTGRWRLSETAVPAQIALDTAANRATLLGGAIPKDPVLMFPGAAPVQFDTPYLRLSGEGAVIRFDGDGRLRPAVEMAPTGLSAITTAVSVALNACLAGQAKPVAICPVPDGTERVVPGSLRGKLNGDPNVVVSLRSSPDGLVEISGTASVDGRWQSLNFDNLGVEKAGTTTVEPRSVAYLTTPLQISWVVPR